jgi:hypothetical protein
MVVKNPLKIPKYFCENCEYQTGNKKDFTKHLSTAKHKKIVNDSKKSPKIPKTKNDHFVCVCGKTYKYDSGYYRHKKVCQFDNIAGFEDITPDNAINHVSSPDNVETMMELIKQNQEFKELIVEQNKQLIELVQKPTTTNNTINNNQKFNLQVFLNEQCKDAINMSEFLSNMTLDIEDLTETGRLGYVGGISRILINKLQELDIYKRPLHCTDLKRETLYIRDNDVWEKENNSKEIMKELVNKVANKNCKTMRQWTQEHPNYTEMDTVDNQEFMKLSDAILGGFGEHESKLFRDKVIRSVIKEVMINKNI